jgi:hypothetical protein
MKGYVIFTTSIKRSLKAKLDDCARRYNTPKNKIIELALTKYFGTLKKAELAGTFKTAKRDKEMRSFSKHAAGDLLTVFKRKK